MKDSLVDEIVIILEEYINANYNAEKIDVPMDEIFSKISNNSVSLTKPELSDLIQKKISCINYNDLTYGVVIWIRYDGVILVRDLN